MRMIALVIFSVLLTPGCKSTNEAANNVPLREAEWTLKGEAEQSYYPVALEQNTAGDIINAYHAVQVSGENRVSMIGVSRLSPQGDELDVNLHEDEDEPVPGQPGRKVYLQSGEPLLSFAGSDLLLMSGKGNMFQLDQSGELVKRFNLIDVGFDRFSLVAHNSQRACFTGHNDTAAILFCIKPDGTLLWKKAIPLGENSGRLFTTFVNAAFQSDGKLVSTTTTTDKLTLTYRDGMGDIVDTLDLDLPTVESRGATDILPLEDGVVVALREITGDNAAHFRFLHIATASDPVSNIVAIEDARLVPYDADSYLLLTAGDPLVNQGYGEKTADMARYSIAGQLQWKRTIALEDMGTEIGHLNSLQISVTAGVISLLQNKQSAKLYSPVVVPIGYHRFIDNLFVSRFGGDGKLIAEDVVGRLNYLVDYEGFIFKFNQYGFYPRLMLDTGTDYVLAGPSYIPGTLEGPDVLPTVASHALSR